jgi:hypothetical protein
MSNKLNWFHKTGLTVLAIIFLLSLRFLLRDNVGQANELDVLPIARQFADPDWIPGDWYLNQPAGYRLLFNFIFGNLAAHWGLLATSIGGRLFCYGLVAIGLTLLGEQLGLTRKFTLLAVGLLLFVIPEQSFAANEWFVRALEAKAVAYGLILIAIGLLLSGRYFWMALLLGLATSFHVAVGGWAFLAVLGWFILRGHTYLKSLGQAGLLLLIYLAASSFAIGQILDQVATTVPVGNISPSYIYTFKLSVIQISRSILLQQVFQRSKHAV